MRAVRKLLCQITDGCHRSNAPIAYRNAVVGKRNIVRRDGQYPCGAEEKFWGVHGSSIAFCADVVLAIVGVLAAAAVGARRSFLSEK